MGEKCKILACPACEDRDCSFNAEGKCHSIDTIRNEIPSGMFSCSGAEYSFENSNKYIFN